VFQFFSDDPLRYPFHDSLLDRSQRCDYRYPADPVQYRSLGGPAVSAVWRRHQ
jgi:hypothetical protein